MVVVAVVVVVWVVIIIVLLSRKKKCHFCYKGNKYIATFRLFLLIEYNITRIFLLITIVGERQLPSGCESPP